MTGCTLGAGCWPTLAPAIATPTELEQSIWNAAAGTGEEVLVLEAASHLDQGLAAMRRLLLLLLVLIFLLPDLPATQRQTWPFLRRGRLTGADSGKHTRYTPGTLTSLGGEPRSMQGLAGYVSASPGGPRRGAAPSPGYRPLSLCLWLPW